MRLFWAFLKFESRRIFLDRKSFILLVIFLLIALYLVFAGVAEYQRFQTDRESFLNFEQQKVKLWTNYLMYGGGGFRILFQPSPLVIFFSSSNVLLDAESNVDTLEIVRVSHSLKGRNLFRFGSYFRDYSGLLYLFGSLIMLYLGAVALVGIPYLRFMVSRLSLKNLYLGTVGSRLLLLDVFFFSFSALLFLVTRLAGIPFTAADSGRFLIFLLYVLLFLNFFFLVGLLLSVLVRFRRISFLLLLIIWFIFLFIVPEAARGHFFTSSRRFMDNDRFNLDELKTLMDFEKTARLAVIQAGVHETKEQEKLRGEMIMKYMEDTRLRNLNKEFSLNRSVRQFILSNERWLMLFPTTFYPVAAAEMSSKGYYGYCDFVNYILELNNRFMRFYIQKRYHTPDEPVESFVKKDENIFFGRSSLPRSLPPALALLLFYNTGLILAAFFCLRREVYPL